MRINLKIITQLDGYPAPFLTIEMDNGDVIEVLKGNRVEGWHISATETEYNATITANTKQ